MNKHNWKKILIGDWSWSRPIKSLVFIYTSLAVIAFFFGSKFVFLPPAATYDEQSPGYQSINSSNEDKISLIWTAPRDSTQPVLLLAHGNAEDIGAYTFLQTECSQRGWGFLAYDYPGYGLSSGEPNEKSIYAAADSAWQHLTGNLKISPQRIILFGRSVGCGPTTHLASQHRCKGIVLISPFLSAFRTVTRIPLFPGDFFNNQKKLQNSRSPLLIFHGEKDEVIPFNQGKQLFEESPAPHKSFIPLPQAGHNDLFTLYLDRILGSIESWPTNQETPDHY